MIVKYKSGAIIRECDINTEFSGFVSDEHINIIGDYCLSNINGTNSILRQVRKLIALKPDSGQAFCVENIKKLMNEFDDMESQISAKVYRSELRKLLNILKLYSADEINTLTEIKQVHIMGKPKPKPKPNINPDSIHINVNNDVNDKKENNTSRLDRTKISNEELKITDNVTHIKNGNRIVQWRNSNNAIKSYNFNALNYEFTDKETLAQYLYESFENSDWSDSTKVTMFSVIRRLLEFNAHYEKNSNPINNKTMIQFLEHTHKEVLKGGGLKRASLSQLKRNCNSILNKLGLNKIPKGYGFDYKAGGNDLVTDEYSKQEWFALIRALHNRRKLLRARLDNNEDDNFNINDHNEYVINCLCMLCIYTGATSSELFTAYFAEEKVSYIASGKNWYAVDGIKNRASKLNNYSLHFKTSGKLFIEEYFPYIRKINNSHKKNEPLLFPLLTQDEEITQVNGEILIKYQDKFIKIDDKLASLKEKDPSFTFRLQRIRSSSLSRSNRELGEKTSISVGNHTLKVHQANKYSRGNKKVNQIEAAKSAVTLESTVRNGGNIELGINTTSQIMNIPIVDVTEYENKFKNSNDTCKTTQGGVCKGEDNKQTKAFKKSLNKHNLLTESDLENISCGYIIECFDCSNFGVIDDVEDIWCLLSFREQLNNSIQHHCSLKHFIKNYGDIMISIDRLLDRLTSRNVELAMKKIMKGKLHPQWDDEYAIADIMGVSL
ncbi:hypothetical protein C9J21_07655 [Photobacterium phosphoreum]|uniref:hypothetical protein n=1 Tax=Photobacterium phosphoreum TaxID=659 RepID=UPI000D15B63D|nr:hypothetical protein [Photobacterium phosphoreum]PSU80700.1 hypothetical protein CTM67_10390 [Photobacterium phosphoreum]PSW33458.1 hypothetical protein C9J21_07655 [Photobacterium phosphoreum]